MVNCINDQKQCLINRCCDYETSSTPNASSGFHFNCTAARIAERKIISSLMNICHEQLQLQNFFVIFNKCGSFVEVQEPRATKSGVRVRAEFRQCVLV